MRSGPEAVSPPVVVARTALFVLLVILYVGFAISSLPGVRDGYHLLLEGLVVPR